MSRHLLWMVLVPAVALSACATLRCPPPPGPQSTAPPIDTTKACASWRWIGITRPGSPGCPKVQGWTEERLVAEKRESPDPNKYAELIQRATRELERFCVYTIENPKQRLQDVPFPPAVSPDLVRFDQDCALISTSASEYVDHVSAPILQDHFLKQVGRAGVSPMFSGPPSVRLVFLDTHPTGKGTLSLAKLPNSWHGHTLVQIARDLVDAPGSQPAAHVTTQLALPIVRFDPKRQKKTEEDPVRGGFIGTQSHLARAISEAVHDWKRARTEQHLVLNLSVAWDGELFDGFDEESIRDLRAGTQAVFRALQYAAGHDVLVLAAAGNRRMPCPRQSPLGSCPTTGLLLPAAWEEKPPQEETCGLESERRKLLYAVGGLQSNGTPLANARPGGMAQRAAYGEYPVLASYPTQPTKVYVGSSVATAVVSSIAAAVWNSTPGSKSHDVMKILEDSGKDLGDAAVFWGVSPPPDPPVPRVRKITFCEAVKAACPAGASGYCPIQEECSSCPASLARPIVFTREDPPMNSCQAWVFPQPEEYPCLGCPPRSQ